MAQWPGGHLDVVPGGRHETLMDTQDMRKRMLQQLCDFYGSTARLGSSGPAPRASAAPQAH